MPARMSTPKTDHATEGLFGHSEATETPDGEPARIYRNQGSGLSEVSGLNYQSSNGMASNAPTSGGDRQAAYDALLKSGKAV